MVNSVKTLSSRDPCLYRDSQRCSYVFWSHTISVNFNTTLASAVPVREVGQVTVLITNSNEGAWTSSPLIPMWSLRKQSVHTDRWIPSSPQHRIRFNDSNDCLTVIRVLKAIEGFLAEFFSLGSTEELALVIQASPKQSEYGPSTSKTLLW